MESIDVGKTAQAQADGERGDCEHGSTQERRPSQPKECQSGVHHSSPFNATEAGAASRRAIESHERREGLYAGYRQSFDRDNRGCGPGRSTRVVHGETWIREKGGCALAAVSVADGGAAATGGCGIPAGLLVPGSHRKERNLGAIYARLPGRV